MSGPYRMNPLLMKMLIIVLLTLVLLLPLGRVPISATIGPPTTRCCSLRSPSWHRFCGSTRSVLRFTPCSTP
jgi:hypothetical protein